MSTRSMPDAPSLTNDNFSCNDGRNDDDWTRVKQRRQYKVIHDVDIDIDDDNQDDVDDVTDYVGNVEDNDGVGENCDESVVPMTMRANNVVTRSNYGGFNIKQR